MAVPASGANGSDRPAAVHGGVCVADRLSSGVYDTDWRYVMVTIHAISDRTITLGREGENLARSVIFDISDWISAYGGDGTVSLIAQRNGDTEPYPCTVTVDGSAVTWLVTAADTARQGYGKCELRYAVGDVLVKSETWRTYTADSLGTPQPEPPEPQQGWVDKVLEAGQAAVDASVNSPKIGSNGNWFVWDFEANQYVDTGVAASGGVSAVSSVNGKVGAVELTADDVGAATAESVEQLAGDIASKITAPSTAAVGQTIRVKAVDGAGQPTEWEATDVTAGGDEYSPTLPLVVSITLAEEVSMIEITTDKDGNPLSLEEMDIVMNLFGGAGNVNRDSSIMYLNGISTAMGRLNFGLNIGEAGKYLTSSQYIVKREYGHRVIGQHGYGFAASSNNYQASNRFMYINSAEENKILKYPKFTQINLYPVTEGYTFGAGTTINIFGR